MGFPTAKVACSIGSEISCCQDPGFARYLLQTRGHWGAGAAPVFIALGHDLVAALQLHAEGVPLLQHLLPHGPSSGALVQVLLVGVMC